MESSKSTKTKEKSRNTANSQQALSQGLEDLFELSSDWYWEQDEHYRFTLITGEAFGRAGFNPQDYLGSAHWECGGCPVGDDGSWDKHKATLKARQPFTDFLFKCPNPNGELRYISSSGQPVYDDQGQFQGYWGVAKDVTRRVQRELRLTIEHGVTHILAESQSIAEAAPQIIRAICQTLEWSCGARWVPDERGEAIRCAETWGVASPGIDKFLEASRQQACPMQLGGLNRRAWVQGTPLWIQDVTKEETFRRAPDALNAGLHSGFAFPLTIGAEVIGVMEFFSREIHQPDAELLEGTRYIGSQIGQFMQRKQAETALRESEARFRSLTNLSSDWFWEQDAEFRFTRLEGRHVSGDGSAFKSELGKTSWEIGVEVEGEWEAHRALIEAHQPFRDVVMWRTFQDGQRHYMGVSGEPMFDNEECFIGYRGVGKDITERRREEQLLALEHKVNRSLAEAKSASEAIKTSIRTVCETEGWECGRYFRVDGEAGFLRLSDAWSVPSLSVEPFIEDSHDLVYHPGEGLSGKVWESGQPLWSPDVTKDPRSSSGSSKKGGPSRKIGIHSAFVFPVVSESRVIGVINFVSRDVREPEERLLQAMRVIGSQIGQYVQRKRAEEEQRRFRAAMDASADLMLLIDPTSLRYIDVNDAACRALGYTREELLAMGPQDIFSKSSEELAQLYDQMLAGDLTAPRVEGVYLCKDGSQLPIEAYPRAVRSAAGDIIVSIARDIRERRRAEKLLTLEHTVTRYLAEADDVQAVLKAAIRAVCETEGWACGRYFRVDEKAGVLRFAEAWGVSGELMDRLIAKSRELTYARGVGLIGGAWQSGQPIWCADTAQDPRIRVGIERDTGMHGAFVFPVLSEGKTVGVLIFHSREARKPEERLLQTLGVIGSQIGQYVQRKHTEQASLRLGWMFAALSATNDAILHAESPEELYQQVCDAAVHGGKFSNTSILLVEEGTNRMKAVASASRVPQQLRVSHISIDETIPEGRGLVGEAFRTQRLCVSNDFLNDERTRPWHEKGRKTDCRSAAVLPLIQGGRSIGAVLIHCDELNAFDDEIIKLLERMAENVSFALDNFEHAAERRQAQERIEYLATHDSLTDLPNRMMFSQVLNVALQSAQRYKRHFAVLFLDLDRFKIINDTLGHEAGDTLLQEMSKRIKENLRSSDVVARLGGDEFVILLQEVSEQEQVAIAARKLLSVVMKPIVILGQECRVTASIGISIYPRDAQDEQGLMKDADMAMYLAKDQGKNTFQFYSKDINTQSLERLALETSLRRALECDEFFLHYQAKLDLKSGAISGVEALLRWQHPELGIVQPMQFISLAEETGLIVPIGKWVLKTACAQNVAWQNAGLPPLSMAVNLSPRQFTDENLLPDLAAVLAETGLDPKLLELEITESMVMGNIEWAISQLVAIKQMGVRLAIDDFGTGYSSLAQIKRFPIDTIKVDRSFIRDIPQDSEDKAITEAIITMSKTLSLTVVAEGVETQEQKTFLREHACNEMQGYHFSKPIASDQFAELLRTHVPVPSPHK